MLAFNTLLGRHPQLRVAQPAMGRLQPSPQNLQGNHPEGPQPVQQTSRSGFGTGIPNQFAPPPGRGSANSIPIYHAAFDYNRNGLSMHMPGHFYGPQPIPLMNPLPQPVFSTFQPLPRLKR